MLNFIVEVKCPTHGFERFRVKVVKCFNMPSKGIEPHLRSKPKYSLSYIRVGRNVTTNEIEDFLIEYFRERGIWDSILSLKMQKTFNK